MLECSEQVLPDTSRFRRIASFANACTSSRLSAGWFLSKYSPLVEMIRKITKKMNIRQAKCLKKSQNCPNSVSLTLTEILLIETQVSSKDPLLEPSASTTLTEMPYQKCFLPTRTCGQQYHNRNALPAMMSLYQYPMIDILQGTPYQRCPFWQ